MLFSVFGNDFLMLAAVWLILTTLAIHIFFTMGVYTAATSFEIQSRGVVLAPMPVWCLATLVGGVFVAAVFWLVHLSTLAGAPTLGDPLAEPEETLSQRDLARKRLRRGRVALFRATRKKNKK